MNAEFNDEHAGKGGSYVVDKDGKRILQERTEINPDSGAAQAKPATQPKPDKGSK